MAYYCTLDQLKTEIEDDAPRLSDAKLLRVIKETSERIDNYKGYGFEPEVTTRYFDARGTHIVNNGYQLLLSTPLLSVDSLTLANTIAIDDTNLIYSPAGATPIGGITLKQAADARFTQYESNWQEGISIAGIWGYHRRYSRAWSQVTTLAAELSSSAASIAVTDASSLSPGHLIQIESEWLRITAISANTLTLARAQNGSTAALHVNTTPVYVYEWDSVVNDACIRWAGYRFKRRGAFARITYDDGKTTEYPNDMPGDVQGKLDSLPTYALAFIV